MSDPSLGGLLGFHWWCGGKPAKASRVRLSGRRTALPVARIEMLESRAMMAVDIQTVYVGNVNNPADPATGYGSVDHAYRIGKFEVTLNQ